MSGKILHLHGHQETPFKLTKHLNQNEKDTTQINFKPKKERLIVYKIL